MQLRYDCQKDTVFHVTPRWSDPPTPHVLSQRFEKTRLAAADSEQLSGAFTVGKLYYNHLILNILAEDFDIGLEKASQIPTLMQAGYVTGLLLCPVGDIVRLRPFVLLLVFVTVNMWLGLYTTTSFSTCIAFLGVALVLAVVRGPHETGWIGWRGGWSCKMECPALVEQEQV
ncbi:hypothetical protein FOWG_17431 [Fusarium oxysporum f. sp. lycopersici MN25]|nr:hypothetical protein FOWG_17431 [Fusarium oxysporum f. sp. lycopersici MN25]